MDPLRLRIFCAGLWLATVGAVAKVDVILSLMGIGTPDRHLFGITLLDISKFLVFIGPVIMFAGLTFPKDGRSLRKQKEKRNE